MCLCTCLCTVHTCYRAHVCTHVRTHVDAHLCIDVYAHVCLNVLTDVYTRLCISMHSHNVSFDVSLHMSVHMLMHKCLYTRLYTVAHKPSCASRRWMRFQTWCRSAHMRVDMFMAISRMSVNKCVSLRRCYSPRSMSAVLLWCQYKLNTLWLPTLQ